MERARGAGRFCETQSEEGGNWKYGGRVVERGIKHWRCQALFPAKRYLDVYLLAKFKKDLFTNY